MFGLLRRRKGRGPQLRGPITAGRFVAVDTELTGLDEDKDAILSIGAVQMNGGRIELGGSFYRLVSPEGQIPAENVIIHEITPSDVEAKPPIGPVLREFVEFCGDRVLVGHFAAIDMAFLDRDAKKHQGRPFGSAVLDTYSIYEWLRKRHRDHPCLARPGLTKLYDIAKCFGIPVNGAHNALLDAYMTAQLFQRFIPLLEAAGAKDLDDLLRIGIPFKGGEGSKRIGEITSF